jgi:hypothetical protein
MAISVFAIPVEPTTVPFSITKSISVFFSFELLPSAFYYIIFLLLGKGYLFTGDKLKQYRTLFLFGNPAGPLHCR